MGEIPIPALTNPDNAIQWMQEWLYRNRKRMNEETLRNLEVAFDLVERGLKDRNGSESKPG